MILTTCVHAALRSGWLVPVLWLLCRRMPRLAPSLRAGLWWGACIQMLVVWLVAARRCSFGAADHGLAALWAAGMMLRLLLLLVQFRRARRLVYEALPAPNCAATEMVTRIAAQLAVRHLPTVRVSARLKTPVLVGLRRPVLLIPAAALLANVSPELRMALAHELAHLRRRDLWFGLAPVLAQTALFFHPFVWLAVREYVLSREEACDAEARHVTGTAPDEYGAMLLEYVAAARRPGHRKTPVSTHYHSLSRRLNAMRIPYEQPKQGPVGAFCSVCILGAICVSVFQMNSPLSTPTQVASAPPAVTPYRAASVQQALPTPTHSLPKSTQHLGPRVLIRSRPLRVAHAVASDRVRKITRPAEDPSIVALPKRILTHTRVPVPPQAMAEAVTAARKAKTTGVPQPLEVAWDTPTVPSSNSDAPLDLSQMRSGLQALRQQMQEQQQIRQSLSLPPPPNKKFAKQFSAEMQAQFGPQFQRQWKQHDSELRAQLDAELPTVRAEAEQARRETVQSHQFQRLAAQAREQALKESGQARKEALQEADQARTQALQELQKELPRIQKELRKERSRPLPPLPPLAFGTDGISF